MELHEIGEANPTGANPSVPILSFLTLVTGLFSFQLTYEIPYTLSGFTWA